MRTRALIRLAVILSVAGMTTAAFAASANDFKAAYAKAEAAAKQAVKMKTAWTTTDKELKAAKKAADAGKYDEAIKRRRPRQGPGRGLDRAVQGTGQDLGEGRAALTRGRHREEPRREKRCVAATC